MHIVLGVDVAEGGDQSVVAVRYDRRIEEIISWVEPDTMKSVERIQQIADRVGVKPGVPDDWWEKYRTPPEDPRGWIVVDAIGVGSGVASRLHELRYNVFAFKGNAEPPRPKNQYAMDFGNLRAAAIWKARELLLKGELDVPPHPRLREEILAISYFTSPGNGKLYAEPKKDLKGRIGRSPDALDAVVMACWKDPYRDIAKELGWNNDYGPSW